MRRHHSLDGLVPLLLPPSSSISHVWYTHIYTYVHTKRTRGGDRYHEKHMVTAVEEMLLYTVHGVGIDCYNGVYTRPE